MKTVEFKHVGDTGVESVIKCDEIHCSSCSYVQPHHLITSFSLVSICSLFSMSMTVCEDGGFVRLPICFEEERKWSLRQEVKQLEE